jgi:hypothetical protein
MRVCGSAGNHTRSTVRPLGVTGASVRLAIARPPAPTGRRQNAPAPYFPPLRRNHGHDLHFMSRETSATGCLSPSPEQAREKVPDTFSSLKSAVLNMVNVHFLWTCGYGEQSPEPRVVTGRKPQTLWDARVCATLLKLAIPKAVSRKNFNKILLSRSSPAYHSQIRHVKVGTTADSTAGSRRDYVPMEVACFLCSHCCADDRCVYSAWSDFR